MKYFISVLIILCSCMPSSKEYAFVDYSRLHNNQTIFNVQKCNIYPKIVAHYDSFKQSNEFYYTPYTVWSLNDVYGLKHHAFTFGNEKNDMIEIYGQKYNIQELIEKNGFYEKCFFSGVYVVNVFEFSYNSKKYLLMELEERYGVQYKYYRWAILVDITNKNNISIALLNVKEKINDFCKNNIQGSMLILAPHYLGDFNNDGNVDFLFWDMRDNIISVYSILNKEIVKIDDYHIKLKIDSKVDNIYEGMYHIDMEQSKWFFRLKPPSTKNGTKIKWDDSSHVQYLDF